MGIDSVVVLEGAVILGTGMALEFQVALRGGPAGARPGATLTAFRCREPLGAKSGAILHQCRR